MAWQEIHQDEEEWLDINSPDHYNSNTIETIDLIRDSMEEKEFKGYLKGKKIIKDGNGLVLKSR